MSINPQFLPEARPLEPHRQALLDAANVIRQRGHAKFAFEDRRGAVCAAGAIGVAQCGDAQKWSTNIGRSIQALLDHLDTWSLTEWNDAPERTADEVIAALEAAAVAP